MVGGRREGLTKLPGWGETGPWEAESLLWVTKRSTQKRWPEAVSSDKCPPTNGKEQQARHWDKITLCAWRARDSVSILEIWQVKCWLATPRTGQAGPRKGQKFGGLISPLSCPSKLRVADGHLLGVADQLGSLFMEMVPLSHHQRLIQPCSGECGVHHHGALAYSWEPALNFGSDAPSFLSIEDSNSVSHSPLVPYLCERRGAAHTMLGGKTPRDSC